MTSSENDQISGRFFLIGCPRSGTTLLQSFLNAHPEIASFPESNFFNMVSKWRSPIGIASLTNREKKRITNFLSDIGRSDLNYLIPKKALTYRTYINSFIKILDLLTIERGGKYWLEKTPAHLYRIELIERYVINSKFLHIIRKGEDVVASLYEVTNKYPEVWWGAYDIDMCIKRWNQDVSISLRYLNQENHKLVKFDYLIGKPMEELISICDFLGIEFDEDMLQNSRQQAENLILDDEPWKSKVKNNIEISKSEKFQKIFSDQEKDYISNNLLQLNW
jgi:hypothetical protein